MKIGFEPIRKTHAIRWMALLGAATILTASQAQTFTTLKNFGVYTNITGTDPRSTLVQGPDGTLYGTAFDGEGPLGGPVSGTVFKMQPDGSGFSTLKVFTNRLEGANPLAGLTLAGNTLYGTTLNGGTNDTGTVFKVNTDGSGFQVLTNLPGFPHGSHPCSTMTISGGQLFGTAQTDGSFGDGLVFRINTNGTGYSVLREFTDNDGTEPSSVVVSGGFIYCSIGGLNESLFRMVTDGTLYSTLRDVGGPGLTLADGVLYGTTLNDGASGNGTLFRINPDGSGFAILKNFTGSDGSNPYGPLLVSGTTIYGTTRDGGSSGNGLVFKISTSGTGYAVLQESTTAAGQNPYGGLVLSGSTLYGTASTGGSSGVGTIFKLNTLGGVYAALKSFTYSDGAGPQAGLALSGGVLYGTTQVGGPENDGTVFKLNADGSGYTVLKNFIGADGVGPTAGITVDGGFLFGTASGGGSTGSGTVFKLNPDGTGFTNMNGGYLGGPNGTLTASGGVLYGTTLYGGANAAGSVFRINADGTGFATLKDFSGVAGDGAFPAPGLALADGVLYGTTSAGGDSNGDGLVFKINTDGSGFTVLKEFSGGGDGSYPYAPVIVANGILYGTAFFGGDTGNGTVFKLNIDGSGFTVLQSFEGTNGAGPASQLALSGSVLYGTTFSGGSLDSGTVFQMNTDGTGFATLKEFALDDGANPISNVTVSGNRLYGTTSGGGTFGEGTIFLITKLPSLTIQPLANAIVLSWPEPSFALQAGPSPTGVFTNVPGATSPWTNATSGGQAFFRLIGN